MKTRDGNGNGRSLFRVQTWRILPSVYQGVSFRGCELTRWDTFRPSRLQILSPRLWFSRRTDLLAIAVDDPTMVGFALSPLTAETLSELTPEELGSRRLLLFGAARPLGVPFFWGGGGQESGSALKVLVSARWLARLPRVSSPSRILPLRPGFWYASADVRVSPA